MHWLETYKVLSAMKERLKWSREELDRYRLWKLRNLVRYAYYNSSFYRSLYDQQNVKPDQIETLADVVRLPIIDKQMLRSLEPLEVVTEPVKQQVQNESDWMTEVTSGSTGVPLRIRRTWRDLHYIKAKIIRAFGQTGFRFYHKQAVLKSSSESLSGKHWFERFGVLRKYWLSVTDPPDFNLRRLQEITPQHVHGYPSGLQAIAQLLEQEGKSFHIPVICSGAEVLEPLVRRQIAEAFRAEIFDLYGVREVGNVAWECKAHDGLHINDDALIVELLGAGDQPVAVGEEGEVVVTYLDATDYPFIRYRLGDRAVQMAGTCKCGVQFNRLNSITGRTDARILLPSGKWISGMVFQELRTAPWVSVYRLIQEDLKSVKLQVVPKKSLNPNELEALVTRAQELVNNELRIIPEVLSRLEYDASGKLRSVICRIDEPQDQSTAPSKSEDD
ncbi:hypothetical protein KJ564_05670 [bacterium]|nr:hypothetical protein [bacterium]